MRRLTNWIMWLGWLLLFASGLLFGLAVARAEASEAWVMWFEVSAAAPGWELESTESWHPQFAFQDLDECYREAARMLDDTQARYLAQGYSVTRQGQTVLRRSRDGFRLRVERRCLPATIDPRPR
jgi:hypothetical protein